MTRKTALALGIGASLMLAAGAASADCASEVHDLQQRLTAVDVPSDTSGTSTYDTSTDMSATGETTASPSGIEEDTGTATDLSATGDPATDPVMGTETETAETPTLPSEGSVADADPSTDFESGSSTMSPSGDALDEGTSTATGTQTVPSGTVTETTRTGEITTPADSRSAALASLKKAELYADAGQEDACMSELSIAKQHMGVE